MKDYRLNGRLLSAAKYVRQGARFADIGTDHAYLPIFLLSSGAVSYAVCADINEGPLNSARMNASECGITESIEFVLTDGIKALENKNITDYAVCGMGGELIADIIEKAPHLKSKGIRLILGPMSRQAYLRSYLARSGFAVIAEDYSLDAGKYYLTVVAEYTGACREISAEEAEIGSVEAPLSDEARGYLEGKAKSYLKAIEGKKKGKEDFARELLIYNRIRDIL